MSAVGNLECAVTGAIASTDKAYSVLCDPSLYGVVREAGFSALNLANNHTSDAGSGVVTEMAERLMAETGAIPYGTKRAPFAELNLGGTRCAIVGCMERAYNRSAMLFPEEAVEAELRNLRGSYDAVFVTPHWGKEGEYAAYPSPQQRRIARRWIDAGADGIFGHHPHAIQGKEVFNERPVFYSLGNFDFDHEEGRAYPITRSGLTVVWDPASPQRFAERFLAHADGRPRLLSDDEVEPLRRHLDEISARISDPRRPWGLWSWARSVGPVYIAKSQRSWRKRLSGRRLSLTAVKWLAWNCLPTTLLLRAGSWVDGTRD
jgi:poly-gamma-glutamate synthesis protein (capsule biosynthesis protein)